MLQIHHHSSTSQWRILVPPSSLSWISTSVGSVTYTISLSPSTGDVIMSHITIGTQYTINGLTSNTSYRISVVPSVGMCQGEGKEVMVDTTGISTNIPRGKLSTNGQ